jgi:transposase
LARGWDGAWRRSTAAQEVHANEEALLALLQRWKREATHGGRTIARIAVAFEAGRDGFWLARWLRARGIETHVIHPTSIAVSREHRRAKTDRLDTELLKRAFLGWLRGERGHCSMAAIPTLEEEDARRRAVSGRSWLLNAPASGTG